MRLSLLAATLALAASLTAAAADGGTATSNGQAARVFAETYVQVEQNFSSFVQFPTVLGTARIKIQAYDYDPSHPLTSFQQQSDQALLSCTPVSGTDPCAGFPQHETIYFVDRAEQTPSSAGISTPGPAFAETFVTLHDGGAPGNGATGQKTILGTPITNDWISWGNLGVLPNVSWSAYLLGGNVTIDS
jgi:hypothetical protein